MSGFVKQDEKYWNTKTSPTISGKTSVTKTKLDKAKSKLNIANKNKMSKAKLNQTLFNIDQASKKAKDVANR